MPPAAIETVNIFLPAGRKGRGLDLCDLAHNAQGRLYSILLDLSATQHRRKKKNAVRASYAVFNFSCYGLSESPRRMNR